MIAAATARPAGDAGVSMTSSARFAIDPVAKSHLIKFDSASYGGNGRAGSIIDRSPPPACLGYRPIGQPTTGSQANGCQAEHRTAWTKRR
jgi:hypothetical protein